MSLQKAIFSTIAYYSLCQYPLTFIEIVKFLNYSKSKPSVIDKELRKLVEHDSIATQSGFYFLPKKRFLVKKRIYKQKIAVTKRRLLQKMIRNIKLIPFIRLICLSGSFNIDNSGPNSDFDFLVIAKNRRLWTVRALISLNTMLFGWKRTQKHVADRVCLNCFLVENQLQITNKTKKRDFHSIQEYARLIPIIESKKSLFVKFQLANMWLTDYIGRYPWPNQHNFIKTKINNWISFRQRLQEIILDVFGFFWLEKILEKLQKKRIHAEGPQDQIYCSNHCLMLHPSSKSFTLLKKLKEVVN